MSKVKVSISITRNTAYGAIVEMDRSKYDELCKKLDRGGKSYDDAAASINELIVPSRDWQDDSLSYLGEFELWEGKE